MNYSLLKSRTFWTLVLSGVIAAGNAVAPMIAPDYAAAIVVILNAVAALFHLNTAQKAGAVN